MSKNVYEVACYAQKLQSIFKEDGAFYGMSINDEKARVHMSPEAFLSMFVQYEITYKKSHNLYWFTEKLVDIGFFAVVSANDIKELESTMPDQWKLIDSKLNEEDFIFEDGSEEK